MDRFTDKVAIVTGAGSGIGAATAKRFRAEGAAVVLNGRLREKLEEAAQGFPDDRILIIHGNDDQIVPIANSVHLSSKLIKHAKLLVYKGASHGLCTTEKDRVNRDLLAFIQEN